MTSMANDESKSRSISPLASNNTTMVGEIKTGTPIDLTMDSTIIHQAEIEQQQQQQQQQPAHQVPQLGNTTGEKTNVSSDFEPTELMSLQPQNDQKQVGEVELVETRGEPMEEDEQEEEDEEEDPIDRMRSIEILPELFNLLFELNNSSNTKVTAKDFDKYLGSLRLKLSNFKDTMQQIDNINETLVNTFDKIEKLKRNNYSKQQFLLQLKQQVDQSL